MQTTPEGFKLLEAGDYVPGAFYDEDSAFNANVQLTRQKLQDMNNAKADKGQTFTGTLTAAGWAGSSAPYTQTVTIEGLPEDADGDVGLPDSVNDAQDKAARDARLRPVSPQPAGSITIRATGKKPTIAIPFVVRVGG